MDGGVVMSEPRLGTARPVTQKTLRPHQVTAIDLIRASLGRGNRRVVCQGPTGFGKTLVAAKIIEMALRKGNRVIFTAPAVSLINQTVAAFEAEGITDIGVMQASHPRTNKDAAVQVASVQTLAKREIPSASLVIVDECHVRSRVIEALMDSRPDVFFVGLSATPWAKGMGLRWQDLVIPCTIGSLIDAGYLSQFRAYAPDVPDLSSVRVKAGEYVESDIERVMSDGGLVASVVQKWLEKGENRPTLCFGVNRRHAEEMHDAFIRHGVASAYVDAMTDSVHRESINRTFRAGEVKVICSVRTMTTGVDLPVSCIIDAAPTRSEMLHVQKIGRGLRVNPGTEDLIILDHAGNSLRLGLVTDIYHGTLNTSRPDERAEEKDRPREKLPKECAECGALFAGRVCPHCGHERRPVSGVETVEGDLVEITPKKAERVVASRDEKQRWWSAILTVQRERGRSPGWAAYTYRDRFGVWPRGLEDVPGPADMVVRNFVRAKDIKFAKSNGKRGAA